MEVLRVLRNEIDLEKPIFVFYICVDGLSPQSADEHIYNIKNHTKYDNITCWFLPTNTESRVECVYNPKGNGNNDFTELISMINERIDILSESNTFEDFKINIRDWRISKLQDEIDKIK